MTYCIVSNTNRLEDLSRFARGIAKSLHAISHCKQGLMPDYMKGRILLTALVMHEIEHH
jgi:hypothetical protein